MKVEINREPKLSKVDHLYVLLAEGSKPKELSKSVQKALEGSGFTGGSDESITILAGEPRKITLIGLGKEDALTIRAARTALYSAAKTAKRQRDASIAVH